MSSQMGCPEGTSAGGQREAEGLAHHLGCRRGAEELAAAARGPAGTAAEVARLLEAQLALGEVGADALHLARVLAVGRRQRHAAGHQHAGQAPHGRERQHHGRQALVAGGDAENALARRQGADEPPEDDCRVVAVGETVHHACRALRAPVAGIGAEGGEGQALEAHQLLGRGLHEEPDLPVPGVVAEGDGPAVGGAHAPLCREHEVPRAAQLARVPSHARVLRQPEDVTARAVPEHLGGERQTAARPRRRALDLQHVAARLDDLGEAESLRLRSHGVPAAAGPRLRSNCGNARSPRVSKTTRTRSPIVRLSGSGPSTLPIMR